MSKAERKAPGGRSARGAPRKAGRPPASDGELTRRHILDAAQICFATHGYRETSNRLVADAARITSGTIYHYFENKQDLFLSVHEEIQLALLDAVQAATTPDSTFAEAVDRMLQVMLTLYIEHPSWSRFTSVVRTEARRNPEISAVQKDAAWRTLYRDLVDKGVRSGEIAKCDERAVRTVLSAAVLGITQHSLEASVTDHVECIRGFSLVLRGMLVISPTKELH